jgi:hypothetical protein
MSGITIAIWLICAASCATIAGNKGRNRWVWAGIGIATGLIGVVIAACLKKQPEPVVTPQLPAAEDDLDRVARLHELRDKGAISEEEFEYQKSLVLR